MAAGAGFDPSQMFKRGGSSVVARVDEAKFLGRSEGEGIALAVLVPSAGN